MKHRYIEYLLIYIECKLTYQHYFSALELQPGPRDGATAAVMSFNNVSIFTMHTFQTAFIEYS